MDRVDDADNFIESLDTIFVECERYFADLSNQISGQYLLERLHRAHHSILLLVSAWPESERQSINTVELCLRYLLVHFQDTQTV